MKIFLAQNPLEGTIIGPGAENFQPNLDTIGAAVGGKPIEQFLSVLLGFFTIVGGLMFLMYFVFGGLAWLSRSYFWLCQWKFRTLPKYFGSLSELFSA